MFDVVHNQLRTTSYQPGQGQLAFVETRHHAGLNLEVIFVNNQRSRGCQEQDGNAD